MKTVQEELDELVGWFETNKWDDLSEEEFYELPNEVSFDCLQTVWSLYWTIKGQ